ncbi:hypothetical protein D3C80_1844590 [compost metagenome]
MKEAVVTSDDTVDGVVLEVVSCDVLAFCVASVVSNLFNVSFEELVDVSSPYC